MIGMDGEDDTTLKRCNMNTNRTSSDLESCHAMSAGGRRAGLALDVWPVAHRFSGRAGLCVG
jgi:hypothetical protein